MVSNCPSVLHNILQTWWTFGDKDPLNPKHDPPPLLRGPHEVHGKLTIFFKFIFGKGIDKYFHGIYGLFKEARKKNPVFLFKQYDFCNVKRFFFQCSGDVLNVCCSLGRD